MRNPINPYESIVKSEAIYLDTNALMKIDHNEGNSSNLTRLFYQSRIKFFLSWIAFGEFIKVLGTREKQSEIGLMNYLYCCRSLMKDFDIGKIKRAEPAEDRFQFFKISVELLSRHSKLGGGDIWHLMAVNELKNHSPQLCYFLMMVSL